MRKRHTERGIQKGKMRKRDADIKEVEEEKLGERELSLANLEITMVFNQMPENLSEIYIKR